MFIQRIIALSLIGFFIFLGGWGWKLMRDTIFRYFDPAIQTFQWGTFLLGLLLFVIGVAFMGGFIFHKDKKRKLVQPRFMKRNHRES
ncbi:DUF2627 domain-containing protein [Microaerobacter geothermalis]|nr:DUF2627 domain-containing protein [Microaerobacter geothermalis]